MNTTLAHVVLYVAGVCLIVPIVSAIVAAIHDRRHRGGRS